VDRLVVYPLSVEGIALVMHDGIIYFEWCGCKTFFETASICNPVSEYKKSQEGQASSI
jgi:hypothetical protein